MSGDDFRPVRVYYSGLSELMLLGAGMALGWLAANARKGTPVKAAPPPAAPLAGQWQQGVLWSTLGAAKVSALISTDNDAAAGASLEELYAHTPSWMPRPSMLKETLTMPRRRTTNCMKKPE